LFDHDRRTQFSLQGAHRNVRCGDCHKLKREIEGKPVLFYKPTPKECEACHGPEIAKPKAKS
jgi:NAD-dependent SIR2 family protein deacetylase